MPAPCIAGCINVTSIGSAVLGASIAVPSICICSAANVLHFFRGATIEQLAEEEVRHHNHTVARQVHCYRDGEPIGEGTIQLNGKTLEFLFSPFGDHYVGLTGMVVKHVGNTIELRPEQEVIQEFIIKFPETADPEEATLWTRILANAAEKEEDLVDDKDNLAKLQECIRAQENTIQTLLERAQRNEELEERYMELCKQVQQVMPQIQANSSLPSETNDQTKVAEDDDRATPMHVTANRGRIARDYLRFSEKANEARSSRDASKQSFRAISSGEEEQAEEQKGQTVTPSTSFNHNTAHMEVVSLTSSLHDKIASMQENINTLTQSLSNLDLRAELGDVLKRVDGLERRTIADAGIDAGSGQVKSLMQRMDLLEKTAAIGLVAQRVDQLEKRLPAAVGDTKCLNATPPQSSQPISLATLVRQHEAGDSKPEETGKPKTSAKTDARMGLGMGKKRAGNAKSNVPKLEMPPRQETPKKRGLLGAVAQRVGQLEKRPPVSLSDTDDTCSQTTGSILSPRKGADDATAAGASEEMEKIPRMERIDSLDQRPLDRKPTEPSEEASEMHPVQKPGTFLKRKLDASGKQLTAGKVAEYVDELTLSLEEKLKASERHLGGGTVAQHVVKLEKHTPRPPSPKVFAKSESFLKGQSHALRQRLEMFERTLTGDTKALPSTDEPEALPGHKPSLLPVLEMSKSLPRTDSLKGLTTADEVESMSTDIGNDNLRVSQGSSKTSSSQPSTSQPISPAPAEKNKYRPIGENLALKERLEMFDRNLSTGASRPGFDGDAGEHCSSGQTPLSSEMLDWHAAATRVDDLKKGASAARSGRPGTMTIKSRMAELTDDMRRRRFADTDPKPS